MPRIRNTTVGAIVTEQNATVITPQNFTPNLPQYELRPLRNEPPPYSLINEAFSVVSITQSHNSNPGVFIPSSQTRTDENTERSDRKSTRLNSSHS